MAASKLLGRVVVVVEYGRVTLAVRPRTRIFLLELLVDQLQQGQNQDRVGGTLELLAHGKLRLICASVHLAPPKIDSQTSTGLHGPELLAGQHPRVKSGLGLGRGDRYSPVR